MRSIHVLTALALGACLTGCGTFGSGAVADAFSYRFADNQQDDVARVFQSLPEPANDRVDNAFDRPIAVATTHPEDGEGESTVVAIDIEGGEVLWEKPIDARTRPEVLGDVVMTSLRQEVLCLDLRTGDELWRVNKEGLAYVGATRHGDDIAFVVSVGAAGGATRVGHIRMRNARTGARRWDHEIAGVLGHPQAFGDYIFVPWDRQNIAILNATDGIETARIRTTDDIFSWVEAEPAGLFYGHQGIYRFTERSFSGKREESTYRPPPVPDAPRDPLVHDDGFYPMPGTRSARGRIQTFWEPVPTTESDLLPVVDDRFYLVYYRYVFCFDGEQNLQWARMLEQDVIRAHAVTKGLMTIGEEGEMHLLDMRTGNDRWSGGIERDLASAGLDVGDFDPAADHDGGEARDLRTSLIEISGDADNRLTPARAYAVQLLGRIENPEITRDLLDLYAQRSMPSAVREAIGIALQRRTSGGEFIVESLNRHYDYIEQSRVPPLALIVPALLQQENREAVPALISHLLDHETPHEVLPLVARGVVELGDESIVPSLKDFLIRYHADSLFDGEEEAETLQVVSEGIFKLGGPTGRDMLRRVQAGAHTVEPLQVAINTLFVDEARREEEDILRREQDRRDEIAALVEQEIRERPVRLSQAQINQTFETHYDELRACIEDEMERNEALAQVRFTFIIEAEGQANNWHFSPNNDQFVGCIQPVSNQMEFPKFQPSTRRQRAAVTIQLRVPTEGGAQQGGGDDIGPGPWWSYYERRAADGVAPGRPWWEIRRATTREIEVQGAGNVSEDDIDWLLEGEGEGDGGATEGGDEEPSDSSDAPAEGETPDAPAPSGGSEGGGAEGGEGEPWWQGTEE
ncbi:MAG: PQQ-binding-like beta-propeller repeat protein [Myxococcota bacterium]